MRSVAGAQAAIGWRSHLLSERRTWDSGVGKTRGLVWASLILRRLLDKQLELSRYN